jgi:WD40 repeat protein
MQTPKSTFPLNFQTTLHSIESWLEPYPQVMESTIPDLQVSSIHFSHSGSYLAGTCFNGSVLVWDFDTMTLLRTLHGHASAVSAIR